jgi:hypothetical protein
MGTTLTIPSTIINTLKITDDNLKQIKSKYPNIEFT